MCAAFLVGETSVDEALDGLMGRAEADIEPVREILISGSRLLNQSESDDQIRGPQNFLFHYILSWFSLFPKTENTPSTARQQGRSSRLGGRRPARGGESIVKRRLSKE